MAPELDRQAPVLRGVIQADTVDLEALARLEAVLRSTNAAARPCLLGPDQAPIELPEALFQALSDAVSILRTGSAVSISPLHRRLSTTEAGAILGVSRQYLTRIIDDGQLQCERTGKHRRIVLSDLLEYKAHRDRARLDALDAMTAEAGANGEYD